MRVLRLAAPVVIPEVRRYLGCVSWVELDDDIDVSSAEPVLDDASVIARLARLRSVLP